MLHGWPSQEPNYRSAAELEEARVECAGWLCTLGCNSGCSTTRKTASNPGTVRNTCHSSGHGSSQEFPRLVHSTCTSSAPALELHSAQVLEMLVQVQCPRSVQVLQEMLRIQEGVTEQLCNTVVSKKCPSR